MPDAPQPHDAPRETSPTSRVTTSPTNNTCRKPDHDAFPCDRCGTAMFRMHAVWRCPACGYKTDCCGW
ncbi:MAG TPA: hypothetical protein VFO19_15440 [Vicinamibacterales bacterium]|jgi:hypothetical protein|nr:hypothetical protein [Vicinamibacterales bacterium]